MAAASSLLSAVRSSLMDAWIGPPSPLSYSAPGTRGARGAASRCKQSIFVGAARKPGLRGAGVTGCGGSGSGKALKRLALPSFPAPASGRPRAATAARRDTCTPRRRRRDTCTAAARGGFGTPARCMPGAGAPRGAALWASAATCVRVDRRGGIPGGGSEGWEDHVRSWLG